MLSRIDQVLDALPPLRRTTNTNKGLAHPAAATAMQER